MANLLGEPFREYVDDQIRVRQEVHGKTNRTTKELQYLNTRNAWIKMASAVSIDEDRLDLLKNLTEFDKNGKPVKRSRNNELLRGIYDGKNLALKNVLFGGLTSFGSIYRTKEDNEIEEYNKQYRSGITGTSYSRAYGVGGTDQFGYSPMPGITDMSFKCLNRGSIKKMSLNIKCHNRSQFDVIDVLYLRLGYSVFVEWGYDKYLDNDGELINMGPTLIDREFWEDKYDKSDYSKWLPEIEAQRAKTSGNYDGAFGVVSNFSWTFEDDGTYNISLEVTSLGDIIESLKVNLPSVYLSKGDAFYSRKYARMLENTQGDGKVDQDTFYSTLYPGLWESIESWVKRVTTTTDFTSRPSLEKIRAARFEEWDPKGEIAQLAFRANYFEKVKGSLKEDHVFLDNEGNEWKNSIIQEITQETNKNEKDYDIKQSEIRNAVEYAIAKYYDENWVRGFKKLDERDLKSPYDLKQSSFPLEGRVGKSLEGVKKIKVKDRFTYNSREEEIENTPATQDISFPLMAWKDDKRVLVNLQYQRKERLFEDFAGVVTNSFWKITEGSFNIRKPFSDFYTNQKIKDSFKTIFTSEWDTKISPPNNIDVYGDGEIKKGDIYNGYRYNQKYSYGIEMDFLKLQVFNYFSQETNKSLSVPITKDNETIQKLEQEKEFQEKEGKTFAKQAELDKALSARAQTISDYKNQNKNRIYRFFYDIRQNNPNFQIRTLGKLKLPGKKIIGKVKTYIDISPFQEELGEFWETIKNQGNQAEKDFKEFNNPETSPERKAELNKLIRKRMEKARNINQSIFSLPEVINQSRYKNLLFLDKLTPVDNQGYIRLGAFLNYLNTNVIPKIDSGTQEGYPIISIDTNTRTNICYVIDNVVSLDIQKIIINNDYFINGLTKPQDSTSGNIIPIFPNASKYVMGVKQGELKYGQIMNIYFSFDRLQEIFDTTVDKSDVYLFGALKDICSDINECLGNINNIEPVVDENNVIHFIEQTSIPGVEEIAKILEIPNFDIKEREKLVIYGYEGNKSNFVRKIGLTTEISKNYATMITIGATANGAIPGVEATAFSRWNLGLTDRFKNNITDANENESVAPISSSAGQEVQSTYATLLKETIGGNKGFGLFGLSNENNEYQINQDDIEYNSGIIEDFYKLMQAQNSYRDEKDKEGNTIESSVGFLPFNLKLDLDGISGIKIYNKMEIQQRFLPSNYPESLEFIITQVNHKLSNNDWVTSLETVATSKSVLTDKKKKPIGKK